MDKFINKHSEKITGYFFILPTIIDNKLIWNISCFFWNVYECP